MDSLEKIMERWVIEQTESVEGEKKRLGAQLIAQAEFIGKHKNELTLITETLNTCQALLRSVDKMIPAHLSDDQFEDILAGYVGLTSRIQYFYLSNPYYFESHSGNVLEDMLKRINILQKQKSDLDMEYEKKMDERDEAKKAVEERQREVDAVQADCDFVKKQADELQRKKEKLTGKKEELLAEQSKLSEEIDNFEPELEKVTKSVYELKSTYEDLCADFEEFSRIKKGIEQDGFVYMSDFEELVRAKADEAKELMRWSDRTLGAVLDDVDALQDKIEKKRKAGM